MVIPATETEAMRASGTLVKRNLIACNSWAGLKNRGGKKNRNVFVFGVMGFSAHPALNAIGRTAGVGIALAFLLAPVALVLVGPDSDSEG